MSNIPQTQTRRNTHPVATSPNPLGLPARHMPAPVKAIERPDLPAADSLPDTVEDTFPDDYLRSHNLPTAGVTVTIRAHVWKWCMPKPPMWELKKILYFSFTGADGQVRPARKGLILNKTAARSIQAIAQSNKYDDWIGVLVHLTPGRTKSGKPTILVNPPVAEAK